MIEETTRQENGTPTQSELELYPYAGVLEEAIKRLHFEPFLFIVIVAILVATVVLYPERADHLVLYTIVALVLLAICGLGVFLLVMRKGGNGQAAEPVVVHEAPATPPGLAVPSDSVSSPSIESAFRQLSSLRNRTTLRTFMLFGAFMFAIFAVLDRIRAGDQFWELVTIRVIVIGVIMILWLLSFSRSFHRIETKVLTVAVSIGGLGILAMILKAGLELDFYQQGLVQVLMFAGFLLWLPTRTVLALTFALVGGYAGVVLYLTQGGRAGEASWYLTNAAFTVGGSALIVIVGNYMYQQSARRSFRRELDLLFKLNRRKAATERRELLLGVAEEQLVKLRAAVETAASNGGGESVTEMVEKVIPRLSALLESSKEPVAGSGAPDP